MAEFRRSRLERNKDEQISRKTVSLGIATIVVFLLVLVFGLPFLVRFSIFLGDLKNRKETEKKEISLPPLSPRLVVPYEATNSAKIAINGLAEASVEVELLKNDVSIGKMSVSDKGSFVFENIDLNKGENVFNAVALTEKGGSSELSKGISVIYDDVAPELLMTNPSETSLTVDYADFDIVGKSEKGVSVLVNNHVAMVDNDGKFKLKLQLSPGNNDVEIVVRDMAGNETKKKIVIKYDI